MKLGKRSGGSLLVMLALMLVMVGSALAVDPCMQTDALSVSVTFDNVNFVPATQLTLRNTCVQSGVESAPPSTIEWQEPIELVFGSVTSDEVIIAKDSIYVDSVARPDLDKPAKLTFSDVNYVNEPILLRDGFACGSCVNASYDRSLNVYEVIVPGFSNYSLSGRKDFTLYSDPEAELSKKVYQTIDLGDVNRADDFACIVQIYGLNEDGEYVLVQTNPERKVEAKLLGNPDQNLPESLGYFRPEHGLANVYYNGGTLAGYNDFQYVAQCANNSTKLVYEESISTRYKPVGRSMVGRGVWLTDGNNALFIIIGVVIAFITLMLIIKFVKMARE